MKTFELEVPTMFADHHVLEVRRILLELPGVDDLYASSSFQYIKLEYDESKLKEKEILAKLEEAGYLGEILLPQESNLPATENGGKKDFRHTAAFEHTKQVSFHRQTSFSGRALWPCPGMGPIRKEEVEE
jgi:copper chaperone CopZ